MGFLYFSSYRVKQILTDVDIYYIGILKDKLESFFRFFYHYERKTNGTLLKRSENELYNDLSLIPLKILKKNVLKEK